MKFDTLIEYNYDELPEATRYRFAEIELNQALQNLTSMYRFDPNGYQKAQNLLFYLLVPLHERNQKEEAFGDMLKSVSFRRPNRHEQIHYFLYNQQTYKKIRDITSASPNTISKFRFKQVPLYYPIYTHWTPETLQLWDTIKPNLNLWNETLVHSPK